MDFKKNVREGSTLIGAFVCFGSPDAAELMGNCGFDFLMIDGEHCSFSPETIQNLVRAVEITGTSAMVRVPEARTSYVQWALDAGAEGILFPQVRSAEDVRKAVTLCRYPPDGVRGLGPGRASRYGINMRAYEASANQDIAVIVQIENLEAVEALDEILEVEGVDMLFVGPGDLSQVLGVSGQLSHPSVVETVSKIISACKLKGVPVGTLALGNESIRHWSDQGASFILTGSDAFFLAGACTRLLADRKSSGK